MKKYLILAAAAVVATAACTKNTLDQEAIPDVPITFQAANYTAQTKAGEVSVLSDFHAFNCRAFLHAEGVDLNSDGTVKTGENNYQNFFGTGNGETITFDDTNDKWAPSHVYYWPKGTQSFVNFVGWYGTTGSALTHPTIGYAYTASKWTASLTWAYSNATVGAAGANLLYADMAWRYKSNEDAVYKKDGVTEGVPMLFHHALAQINVKAYAYGNSAALAAGASAGTVTDGTATWTITLSNVQITPIYTSGSLSLTNADPGTKKTQAWTGGWSFGGETTGTMTRTGDPIPVDQITKPTVGTTTGDVIAATCVLPQTIGNTVKISFDVSIHTAYSTNANDEIIHKEILFNTMGTTAWAQNTKYTYYLKIIPSQSEVLFDPALQEDWSAGSTTDQSI